MYGKTLSIPLLFEQIYSSKHRSARSAADLPRLRRVRVEPARALVRAPHVRAAGDRGPLRAVLAEVYARAVGGHAHREAVAGVVVGALELTVGGMGRVCVRHLRIGVLHLLPLPDAAGRAGAGVVRGVAARGHRIGVAPGMWSAHGAARSARTASGL